MSQRQISSDSWVTSGSSTAAARPLAPLHTAPRSQGPSSVAPPTPNRIVSSLSSTTITSTPQPTSTTLTSPSAIVPTATYSTTSSGSGTTERPSKCNKCHLPITGAQFIRVANHSFHKDCFHCPICKCSLSDIKPRAKDGVYYCPEDYQRLFCHLCHTCGERISSGGLVKALGTYFHSHHFVCFQCKTPFGDGRYYEHNGQPYCPHHAPANQSTNTSSSSSSQIDQQRLNNNNNNNTTNRSSNEPLTTCTRCTLPIQDYDIISLKGLSFHTKCLHCDHCKCELSGEHSVVYKDGFVLCREDYIKLYSRLCTACGDPILKQIVSINGESYHPDCFCCQVCYQQSQLSSSSSLGVVSGTSSSGAAAGSDDKTKIKPVTLTHYLEHNGHLICGQHKDTNLPPGPCAVCLLPISDGWGVTRTCGKRVHEACFKCYKCNIPLEKYSTRLFNGQLCCISCLAATGFSDTIGNVVNKYFSDQHKSLIGAQTPVTNNNNSQQQHQQQQSNNNNNTSLSSNNNQLNQNNNQNNNNNNRNLETSSLPGLTSGLISNNNSSTSLGSPPPPGGSSSSSSVLGGIGDIGDLSGPSSTGRLRPMAGHQRQQSQFVLPSTNPASINHTPSTPQLSSTPLGTGFNLNNNMFDFNNFLPAAQQQESQHHHHHHHQQQLNPQPQSFSNQSIQSNSTSVTTLSSQGPSVQAPQQPNNNQQNIFRPSPLQINTNIINNNNNSINGPGGGGGGGSAAALSLSGSSYSQRVQFQQVPSTPSHHLYHNSPNSFNQPTIPEHSSIVNTRQQQQQQQQQSHQQQQQQHHHQNQPQQQQQLMGSGTPSSTSRPVLGYMGGQNPPPLQMHSSGSNLSNAPPAPNKPAPSTPRGSLTPLSTSSSFSSTNTKLTKLPPPQQPPSYYPNNSLQHQQQQQQQHQQSQQPVSSQLGLQLGSTPLGGGNFKNFNNSSTNSIPNSSPIVPIPSQNSNPLSIGSGIGSGGSSNNDHMSQQERERQQNNKLQQYHEHVQKQKQQQHNLTPQQRSVLDSYQNPPIPSPGEKYLAPVNREQIQAQREKAAQLRQKADQQRLQQGSTGSSTGSQGNNVTNGNGGGGPAVPTPIGGASNGNNGGVVSPGGGGSALNNNGFNNHNNNNNNANNNNNGQNSTTPMGKYSSPSSFGGMSAGASSSSLIPVTPAPLSNISTIDYISPGSNCAVEWKRGELIGKGSFGKVYMGMNSSNGELIAIKQVNIAGPEDVENINQIQTEIALMSTLSHPNVIKFLGTQRSGQKLNILMEYVPGKSIDVLLATFGPFSEKVMISYTRQLLDALAYCHAQGVVHRDIKGKNVLVDTNGHLKLADFGSAKRTISADARDSPSLGYNYTPLWTAPEVLVGDYNSKVDVWSLGCVVIEMASGKAPWSEHNFEHPFRALYHIANTTDTPRLPDRLSPLGKDFISKCLIRDPDLRPSAKELLTHPWLTGQ